MNSIESMRKYQNDFSIKFAQLMQQRLEIWKNIQKEERASLYSLTSFGMYFFVAALGFIPGKREYDYNLKLHCIIAVIFFIGAIITNIEMTNKTYQNKVKGTFFPELLKVFGENINYVGDTSALVSRLSNCLLDKKDVTHLIDDISDENIGLKCISNETFENCMLYDKIITQREDDDRFWGTYKDVKFLINETDFGWNAKDKYRTYHSMFKGIAMHFKMNKNIKSRVLILSKHSFTKVPKNFEKVELEYSKFAKAYDVWVEKNIMGGSGQIEARYLLNTAFLDRFMQIQTSFKVNKMCCSVFDDEMLIMLSTKRDLFEMNHLFGRIDDIKQYKTLFQEFASVLSFIEVLNLASNTKL